MCVLGRRGAVATCAVVAALAASAGSAPAQSVPYVDWPSLLPPVGAPFTPNVEPDCPTGEDACIVATIAEMERRLNAVVPPCDHRAVFALAYLRVTEDVRDADRAGLFSDSRWLQQEDAVFARMYFEAYDRDAAGLREGVPVAWREAFAAARERELSALGDFLMAMNAHINRDFPYLLANIGITTPDGRSRKPDHDVYNRRLAALYGPVLKEVADRFDPTADDVEIGPVDDVAATAILQSWREIVWRNAERLVLASGDPAARARVAADIEGYATGVARTIRATFRGDADARAAWCAVHGGQDPAKVAPVAGTATSRAGVVGVGAVRRAASGRVVRVPLTCPAGAVACRGSVALERPRGRGSDLARRAYRVAPGARATVVLRARRAVPAGARVTVRRVGVSPSRALTRRAVRG